MKNISFSYGDKKVLHNFNLNILTGKIYCLVGSSGSGKTTTLRLINGLLKPLDGEIYIQGKKFDFAQSEKWRRSMGYSIQGSGLFPHMTLAENLSIIARKENWGPHDIQKRIEELCELMSLPKDKTFLNKKPREISGGQQQRVGIARALFMRPKIMLMDEPFSALDPITRSELQKEFLKLQSVLNLTIVLVTHDLSEAFSMANEIVLLNKGRIEQQDRPRKFLLNPKTDYVKNFMKSHSPGNLLKEIYLYSVMNSNIFSTIKKNNQLSLRNIETSEETQYNSLNEVIDFLKAQKQNYIYWTNENNQLKGFQEIKSCELSQARTTSLLSTHHILFAMKNILTEKTSALPVINDSGELVGVFSDGALNAL